MAQDPRAALERLIGAFENFHEVASKASDPDSPSMIEAGNLLAEAYTLYDDVMFRLYDAELPLDVYNPEDYEDDADLEEEFGEDDLSDDEFDDADEEDDDDFLDDDDFEDEASFADDFDELFDGDADEEDPEA